MQRMTLWVVFCSAFLLLCLGSVDRSTCQASPESGDVHAPLQSKPGEGGNTEEIQVLKDRIIDLQNKGKLGFRKVVACSSAEGFGVYSPVVPGQHLSKVVFYYEPSNISTMRSDGRYVIDCSVDLTILDHFGKKLGGGENVVRINRVSRSPILDVYFRIQIDLKKLPNRGLTVATVLRDKIKNQSATSTFKMEGNLLGAKNPDGNI